MDDKPANIIDWRFKSFPSALAGLTAGEAAAQSLSVLDGDFLMPVAILKGDAIATNIRWMQSYMQTTGVDLCPHGKTTMSPELFALQKDAGAWGMTAATAHHVRLYRKWGVGRVLLANQLIAPADIRLILDEIECDANFEFYCLVDSQAGAERLADAVRTRQLGRPVNVLIEVGGSGGRTGVRTVASGLALANYVGTQSDALALRGVELFEGIYASDGTGPDDTREMLEAVLALASQIHAAGLFATGDILLTGGGSSLFDICAQSLRSVDFSGRQRVILRSGCYIIHDHGTYHRAAAAIALRQPGIFSADAAPMPALEVWAVVQSVADAGFAVAGLGKRDVGFDAELPLAIWHYRQGQGRVPADQTLRISKLYDQHACLEGAEGLAIGDLIGFGISHPCTTFDKWRAMPVVNADYRMTSFITTVF